MDKNLSLLLQDSFTKAQATKSLSELSDLLNLWLFGGEQDLSKAKAKYPELNLPEEFFRQFNQNNMAKVLKEIQTQLEAISILTIGLPLELPEEEVRKLGLYLRSNFKNPMLIEFKLNPMLIAGPTLILNGVSKDYSLKAKIEENHEAILANFKKGAKI